MNTTLCWSNTTKSDMQLFFNTPCSISYGLLRYTQWDYVRQGLLRNLLTVQSFYYSRIYSVKSNHFLARLTNTLNISFLHSIERYYAIADAKAANIAAAMKMTSSMQRGALFNGVFYGPGCTEVIMMDNSSFDPFEVYKNWKTAQSVKVVIHPRSDLSLMLPNGKNTGLEKGLAVISINIPMLAIQYRAFAEEQLKISDEQNIGTQSVPHFVHRYLLPNMMASHLDIAIFNRIQNLLNGKPLAEVTRAHSFALVDYSSQATKVHTEILEDLRSKSMEYKAILSSIPAISKDSLLEVMVLPESAPTRQIFWAEVLSRIDVLRFTINVGGDRSIERNQTYLNTFARDFRLYQGDRAVAVSMPRDLYLNTFSKMQQIATLAGRPLLPA